MNRDCDGWLVMSCFVHWVHNLKTGYFEFEYLDETQEWVSEIRRSVWDGLLICDFIPNTISTQFEECQKCLLAPIDVTALAVRVAWSTAATLTK